MQGWIATSVLFCLVLSLQTASAAYLSSVAVELLAPAAGKETYLWIGFRTSNSPSSYSPSEGFPYHSLLIQEESFAPILTFSENCSSLLELAGGWPGSIACDGGLFQFHGVLKAATWYELVILVSISSSAIGTSGTRLRLLVGRQAAVPVPSQNFQDQVEFFESSFGAVETGPVGGFHPPGPYLGNLDRIFDIVSPRTFLLPSISFVVRMSLQIPALTSPMTFLLMARPFTSWALQPPGASVVAPGEEDVSASCALAITWLQTVPVFRCYWISFGHTSPGAPARANGLKLIFDELPPPSLTLQFLAQSPPRGSYEEWLAVVLEGDGLAISNMSQTMPSRALSPSIHGVLVQAAPMTQVLSYTSSAISTLNTLRLQVVPGITIHGLETQSSTALGHLKLSLPTVMGQMFSCSLEPLAAWSGASESFGSVLNSEQKTCTISVNSANLHFFAESSYVIRLSFYNAAIPFRGDTWSLELRAPGSAALSFPIPSPFDVVSAFTLFQVRMTRLAVSQSQNPDQMGLVRIDFQLAGESERLGSDDPVLCTHLRLASGFWLGDDSDGSECQNFQIHTGVPPATTCKVFDRGTSAILFLSSRLVPGLHMAFSISMWNPNASLLLQGQDVAPWTIESRYSSCGAAGRVHAQRVGQSSPFGNWPQALYPLPLEISRISASSLTLGSEASVTLHFILPVPIQSGSWILVSAPYEWTGLSVDTSAVITGASDSWSFQQTSQKAQYATELLLMISSELLSLVTYGLKATLIHPSADLVVMEDPQWWSLEVFGVYPGPGYREDPTALLPFEGRFAAGTSAGYSLRRLRQCDVLPWKNEIGATSPVVLRFSTTIAMDRVVAIPVLVVSPPLAFSFTRPCKALVPRPSSAEMKRKPLEGLCRNNPTNRQVWIEIGESISAFVPYVLELWSLQMPNQLSVIGNVWTLHLQRKIDSTDQTVEHDQEVAQCEGIPGFGLAWPLLKALVEFRYSSFRPSAVSQVTFLFGTPEATMGDFSLMIHGPVGASFPLDCSSALVDIVVSLASAALPGRLLSCAGGGGDADRAVAQLSFQYDGSGGLVVGEVYAITMQVTNRPYINGLSKHSNSWRLSISDRLWYASEAISAGIPSYEMTEPPVIEFRVSSQRSTDRHSLAGPERANVTLRFTVPEAQPAGTHLFIYAPLDSFAFVSPCRISRPDQLDWVPDPRASQTEQVFTGSCKPSCVLLATPERCEVETPTFARVVIALELEATISYCFAIETLSPEQGGLGLWTLEFRSPGGALLESTGPVLGPQAGAMALPTAASGSQEFVVSPSTQSRAATVVTLTFAFSLPLPMEGSVTIIPPAIAGQLAYHAADGADDVIADSVPLAKDMELGRIGVPFFDFSRCCSGFQNTTPLPPWSCLNSLRAMSLSSEAGWKAFHRYGFILREVPGGTITGAMRLHQDSVLPSFTLVAIASTPTFTALGAERSAVLAMGEAAGWPLATELRVQDLSMEQPLLETRGFSKLYLVVRLLTALTQEARLVVRPPARFRISWDSSASSRLQPRGAGLGSNCQPNSLEASGPPPCFSMQCYVSVLKTGQNIAMPHCSEPAGCCYGLGTAGAPAYVQLLPSMTATPLLPGTRLEVTFLEVQTSGSVGAVHAAWTLATEKLQGNIYEVVDEAQQDSPELYEGVRRAVVEPTYSFLSYDRELVVVLFELESALPRAATALLTFLAPPGFVFQSGPLDWSNAAARLTYMRAWSKAELPQSQALQGNGNIAAKSMPEGILVNLHGPRLDIEIPAELGGGSLLEPLVPYSFPAYVDCPDVLQGRDQSFWLLRTYTFTGNVTRPVHWGRLPGFVLRGSIPQLQIHPTTLLPLFPRNVLRLTFMLSQDLPRAAPPPPGVAPCLRACASMLLVIPPLGYVFPENCEAPEAAQVDEFQSISTLPPPFECKGVTLGAYSNASLMLLEAEESSRTGMLLKDQEYQVQLLVRNPLFNPDVTENTWRLMTRWAESASSYVTLHEAALPGFSLTGMEGSLAPGSVNPGVFHLLNITVVPRNDSVTGSDVLRLQALFLVAPRGIELTCAGFLPGSLGGGQGPGGWDGAERFACMTQENMPLTGPCGQPGVPVPPGLWSLCLAAPRRPAWATSLGSLETPPCAGDVASCTIHAPLTLGNGTQAFAGQALWFGVFVTNPQYMPFDNTWLLVVLGDKGESMDAGALLDVAGMDGYQLLKAG